MTDTIKTVSARVPAELNAEVMEAFSDALEALQTRVDAIVQRKPGELVGEPREAPPAKREPAAKPTHAKPRKAKPATRARISASNMRELTSKVLAALDRSTPRSRADVAKALGLGKDSHVRLSNVLRGLRDDGQLVMSGSRSDAMYLRVGGA